MSPWGGVVGSKRRLGIDRPGVGNTVVETETRNVSAAVAQLVKMEPAALAQNRRGCQVGTQVGTRAWEAPHQTGVSLSLEGNTDC